MNSTNKTYDPNDFESILLHKEYNELTAEEHAIVNEHADNEQEYHDLRITLTAIMASNDTNAIAPRQQTKSSLLEEFNKVHKATAGSTSNSSWFSWSVPSFRYTLLGGITACVTLLFIYLNKEANDTIDETTVVSTTNHPDLDVNKTDHIIEPTTATTDSIIVQPEIIVAEENDLVISDTQTNDMIEENEMEDTTETHHQLSNSELMLNGFIGTARATGTTSNFDENGNFRRDAMLSNSFDNQNSYITIGDSTVHASRLGFSSNMYAQSYMNPSGMLSNSVSDSLSFSPSQINHNFGQQPTPAIAPKNMAKSTELLKLLQTAVDR